MPGATVKDCLSSIGVSISGLSACSSLKDEWALVKKAYFKKILLCHPDKGGDAATFREVQTSFEVLRKLFDGAEIDSFSSASAKETDDLYKGSKSDLSGTSTPSWEYYAEAAKEASVSYRVELARSNRSRCQARGTKKACSKDPPFIEKGSLRVGFMLESGSYGLWVHLECWRVPSKIWFGLPDPFKCRDARKFEKTLLLMNEVSLSGMKELTATERKKIVKYVMDKAHWTFSGVVEKVRKKPTGSNASASGESAKKSESGSSDSTALVVAAKKKQQFEILIPGKDAPQGSLSGQTFVITGTFPEVGGGAGFNLGKDKLRKMIVSFGGKVTTSVSNKTDVLVVGKEPGFSKISQARSNPKTRLLGLHDLKLGLQKGSLEHVKPKPMLVDAFAKGFGKRRGGPNSKALQASSKQLAIASGTKTPMLKIASKASMKSFQTKKRKASGTSSALKSRRTR